MTPSDPAADPETPGPGGRRAVWNLLGLGLCTAVSQGCAFGVLLVLTDRLTPAGFGAVVFALNLQIYLLTFGTVGLTAVVVRDLTQRPDRADETTTAYLVVVALASAAAGVVSAA